MEFPEPNWDTDFDFGDIKVGQKRRNTNTTGQQRMWKRTRTRYALGNHAYATLSKRKRKKIWNSVYKKSASKFKKSLKRYQKPEAKRCIRILGDISINPGTDVSNTQLTHRASFPTPIIGTGSQNRIGKEIQVYGVTVKMTINQVPAEVTGKYITYTNARVCIIYDKSPNGNNLPPVGDLFEGVDHAGTTIDPALSVIRDVFRKRFKIIKEWNFELDGQKSLGFNICEFIKIKRTQLYGLSNTIDSYTDLSAGGLILCVTVARNNQGIGSTDAQVVYLKGTLCLHFIDT